MNLVERIRQRIEVFQPGGDNERLLIEAADPLELLEEYRQQSMSLLDEQNLLLQEAIKEIVSLKKTDPDIVHRLRYTRVGQTMRDAADEIERLRQGLWDCARLAGEDLDGDNTPDHLVLPDLVVFAHNAIRSLAEVHGYLADDVDRLEAEIDRLRALIKTWCDAHEKANVIDAFGQYDEACEALRKAVGR